MPIFPAHNFNVFGHDDDDDCDNNNHTYNVSNDDYND